MDKEDTIIQDLAKQLKAAADHYNVRIKVMSEFIMDMAINSDVDEKINERKDS